MGLWVFGPWPKGERIAYGGVVVDASKASKEYSVYLNKKQMIDASDRRTRGLGAWANTLRGEEQTSRFKYNADIVVDTKSKTAALVSRGIRQEGWVEVFCPYGKSFRFLR